MTKVEIIALAEKWEAAAQRAEARYQDSGGSPSPAGEGTGRGSGRCSVDGCRRCR